MSQVQIPIENAVAIRRDKHSQVTFQNLSATDVYLSYNRGQLDTSVNTTVPVGIKVAANGGLVQLYPFLGLIWARAAAATQLIVEP